MVEFDWTEVRSWFKRNLKQTNHIMTFGTIGSCNLENDLDLIITKKVDSSSSDFYKEIHVIFDNLNSYLKSKYGRKLVRFTISSHETEVKKLSNYRKGDLLLHAMIYTSLDELRKEWERFLSRGDSIKDLIEKNYDLIFGRKSQLFSEKFSEDKKFSNLYIFMADHDRINSNLPPRLLIKKMNFIYDYLLRKRLGVPLVRAENVKQVREIVLKNPPKKLGFIGITFDATCFEPNLLVFPSVEGKVGEALVETIEIVGKLERALGKKGFKIPLSHKRSNNSSIFGLYRIREGDANLIRTQLVFFPDKKSFDRFSPKYFKRSVQNSTLTVFGDKDVLCKLKSIPQRKLEPYFEILHSVLGTDVKISKEDFLSSVESLNQYLRDKYNLRVSRTFPRTLRARRKEFARLMKQLDRKTYS